jgi:inosose dehydratase
MRIGAHTYLFTQYGFDQAERLEEIFQTVADAGYQAIEVHAPVLAAPDWHARSAAAVAKTGLGLVGGSSGQPLWDPARWDAIRAAMDAYSDKLAALRPLYGGAGRIQCGTSCSGKRLAQRTPEENAHLVRAWTELGQMFRSKGVCLNYHTHGEPIEDIRYVVDNVPADVLALGPDLDWLRVGGIDPEAFVREHGARLTMLHARDYHAGAPFTAERRTEALGEGDVDYARLGQILAEVGFDGEFVVELAIPPGVKATRTPLELLTASREHLRRTIGL